MKPNEEKCTLLDWLIVLVWFLLIAIQCLTPTLVVKWILITLTGAFVVYGLWLFAVEVIGWIKNG
jgi:type IV secretory pathway TrbL component